MNGMEENVITKPHNLYMQIGIQTGVISLIAFILFYLAYFISSARLYIRGRFTSFYSRFGLAVFVGTIGYMISGISYDSSITTAPIFWVLIGTGIAVNSKAKPLILKEIAELKEEKANKKADIKVESLQKADQID
jgi:O-antigen ligase